MNKFNYILLFLLCFASLGCEERQEYRDALSRAEAVMETNPDSALVVLDSLSAYSSDFNRHFNMQYQLQLTNARMKSGILFTTDSLTLSLIDYFDSHGTDDERALAYYIYGCSLVDLGQAPEALQAYYTALESIDTTQTNCNYNLLKGIYGQMSQIFHQQNLPHDEIWALKHYIENVERTSDPSEIAFAKSRMTSPYYLLNRIDTVLQITQEAYETLKSIGDNQNAAIILGSTIHFDLEKGELNKVKKSIEIYENESGLFDKSGNIANGFEGYYCYKGLYELAINQLDSAEVYFRKAIRYDYTSDGYKGLMSVYRKRNNVDSVFKFSLLYEAAQDTLHNQMRTTAIHQMSALYNYNRSQKEAEQEREKSRILKMSIVFVIILFILLLIFLQWLYLRNQRKKKRELAKLNRRLQRAATAHSEISAELQMLKDKDYDRIIAEKESKECALKDEIEKLNTTIKNYQQTKTKEPVDNLDAFLSSDIALLITKKANSKTEKPHITDRQWSLLQSQFCKSLPAMNKAFTEGKSLSELQKKSCILILLGISDATIRMMLDCSKSVFSDAKLHSNVKLFGQDNARSLRNNLLDGLKST